MSSPQLDRVLNRLAFLCVLCASALDALALDREAFTFASYDLNVQVEPEQHRLGVRGKIALRNDSPTPQRIAVLQISSSLDWRSIKMGDKAVQFVTQAYTSDVDHTGALSEAIVSLPQPVLPKDTIDLDIGYEGVVLLDATRLTRIGTPEDVAKSTDWDQISPSFTALRGAGYVAWYPIATESANLSEGNSLFEILSRWKARETGSKMQLRVSLSRSSREEPRVILAGVVCALGVHEQVDLAQLVEAECPCRRLGFDAPSLVIADYQVLERAGVEVHYLPAHAVAAEGYADAAGSVAPFISEWLGPLHEKVITADLPDANAAPFESGSLLLTPLANPDSKLASLAAAHQLTHAAFLSFRPWIEEGLAHFAQALYLEHEKGRRAALDYMSLHRSAFIEAEKAVTTDETNRSLVSTSSDELYRSKAMYVWWMLRDMVGDAALKKVLAAYRPEQDKDPTYMPHLIAAQTQRDLEGFFDDWIYHDRGLPDFKVESAFSGKISASSFLVTITVNNLGTAGAEVPLTVRFSGGEVTKRLEVRARSKATIRIETPAAPQEVAVNDGSVPESDVTNNIFRIEAPAAAK